MSGIDDARKAMDAAARGEPDDLWKAFELVLQTGVKLKAVMVAKGLTLAKAKCPRCNGAEALHGRLVTGPAAGRHRRSGGAFRMWCDTCPDIRMME